MSISRYWGPDLSSAGRYLGSESDCRSVARSGDAQHPAGASPSGLRDRHVRHLHPDVRDCGGAALRRALRILFGEHWWFGYFVLGTVRCKERPAVFCNLSLYVNQFVNPPPRILFQGFITLSVPKHSAATMLPPAVNRSLVWSCRCGDRVAIV